MVLHRSLNSSAQVKTFIKHFTEFKTRVKVSQPIVSLGLILDMYLSLHGTHLWLGSVPASNFLHLSHVSQWHLPILVLLTKLDWS